MKNLAGKYPNFINDFTENILGAGPMNDTNTALKVINRKFFTSYSSMFQATRSTFADLAPVEKDLNKAFRHLKYYFPKYPVPQFLSYIGPFDAPGVALTQNAIAIGLQLYAGKDFAFYTSEPGQQLYPAYLSRRFEKAYIPTNCVKAVLEDIYPDKSQGMPLVDQMIEKGKYWWLLNLVQPDTPDSIKTGFTQVQLDWCKANEGVIWNLLLQNDQLYSTEPSIVQLYIGEGPTTQGFPPVSPGNIGQWIGWQIVKTYLDKHPDTRPEQLLATPPRDILDGAKYKPR